MRIVSLYSQITVSKFLLNLFIPALFLASLKLEMHIFNGYI